jgi:hypothetical protein
MNRNHQPRRDSLRTAARSGRRLFLCLLWALLLSNATRSQDIPSVGQPTTDFYNARGSHVRVEWKLDRTTVPEDEEFAAALVITGATNPREITRPDLRKLPAFESRFVIAETTAPPPAIDAKELRFHYRLRPRNRSVDKLPTLAFHYYNPAAAVGKEFPLTTAKEVPIRVTAPRPKPEPPAIPLGEPEWLVSYAPRPVSLARPTFLAGWSWAAIALGGPLAALAWYAAWRHLYPDAARLARRRRTRAARRAIDAIQRASRAPDPPAAIAAAVLSYLRARFPLSSAAATPGEIGAALADLGLSTPERDAVVEFFRASDAARFAPTSDNEALLAQNASALVARLEAI